MPSLYFAIATEFSAVLEDVLCVARDHEQFHLRPGQWLAGTSVWRGGDREDRSRSMR